MSQSSGVNVCCLQLILARLTAGSRQRPAVSPSSLAEHAQLCAIIRQCWAGEPGERPAVDAVRAQISRIYTETSHNILDNLLSRMEQYADNLEQLVEERTQSYLEEKEKCENLLYELLPPSVADKLIHKVTLFSTIAYLHSSPHINSYFRRLLQQNPSLPSQSTSVTLSASPPSLPRARPWRLLTFLMISTLASTPSYKTMMYTRWRPSEMLTWWCQVYICTANFGNCKI